MAMTLWFGSVGKIGVIAVVVANTCGTGDNLI
jgi:hypothetical protein